MQYTVQSVCVCAWVGVTEPSKNKSQSKKNVAEMIIDCIASLSSDNK